MATLIVNGKISHDQHFEFHGACVFTTLRSKKNELYLWPLHWQRLLSHAKFFNYRLPKEAEILNLLDEIIKTGPDQKIRVILFPEKFAILSEPYSPPSSTIYDGVTVILSSMKVHPQLCRYKTGNSLPYTLAYKEAQKQNAFEALLCNTDGHVVDGSRTSLMMFDGEKFTILDGGLYGCMRAHIVDYLKSESISVEKRLITPRKITGQLLLFNSLMGVIPTGPVKFHIISQLVNHFRMDLG